MVYNKQQLLGEEWKNKTNAYVPKDAKKFFFKKRRGAL